MLCDFWTSSQVRKFLPFSKEEGRIYFLLSLSEKISILELISKVAFIY